ILIPLLAGLLSFAMKDSAKGLSLVSALGTLAVAAFVSATADSEPMVWSMQWIPRLGTQFSLQADGMSAMLCLLTGIVMPVIFISNWNKELENPGSFYGLMLLSQAGITGVFLSYDALLF